MNCPNCSEPELTSPRIVQPMTLTREVTDQEGKIFHIFVCAKCGAKDEEEVKPGQAQYPGPGKHHV